MDRGSIDQRNRPAQSSIAMLSLVAELWQFMRIRKKFWLLPIMLAMALFGGLTIFTKGSAIAPFIYTLF
jgi:hypothetical protein